MSIVPLGLWITQERQRRGLIASDGDSVGMGSGRCVLPKRL